MFFDKIGITKCIDQLDHRKTIISYNEKTGRGIGERGVCVIKKATTTV